MASNPSTHPHEWFRDDSAVDKSRPPCYIPTEPHLCNPPYRRKEKTKEERAEIMRRHLPNLYAAVGKCPI